MPDPLADVPAFLQKVEIFAELSLEERQRLAAVMQPRRVGSNEDVFAEGDPGDAMYVVVFGQVDIERRAADGERVKLMTLGPHDIFGEMALFDDVSRSATARTGARSAMVLQLRREVFVELLRGAPEIALRMLAHQGRRLRQLNDRVVLIDQEVRKNAPTLLETVVSEYPHPIALVYQELDATEQLATRLQRGFELVEVLLRYTVAHAAGAYLAQSHYDAEIDQQLLDLQRGSSLGAMMRFVRTVGTHLGERHPTPGIATELYKWAVERQHGRQKVAEAFDQIIERRNELKHGSEAALDEEALQKLLADVEPRVELLIRSLDFLRQYPVVHLDAMTYAEGTFRYTAQVCRGAFRNFRQENITHARPFDTQRLYVWDRARGELLPLFPWMGLYRCTTCGDRDIFLVSVWGPKKLDMIEFGRGHRLAVKEVPASVGALGEMLRARLGARAAAT